ncbi:hypothetical protein PR003_g3289 [Phytophthora rubi]|uniref:RxLR effector protein n=1 Tax=Phytophthora rubi TaxID=129364 RepID=A0A6A3NC32_9STRA|nr:hypothetical protein PR002_g3586 [Phytophthora rubi]KAE9050082.1 hypothetical protein PR001_g2716 [Phytophthora rubi]KAE9354588.1 hypothetical protein PR003_g3289 [Phytophthora rubi]
MHRTIAYSVRLATAVLVVGLQTGAGLRRASGFGLDGGCGAGSGFGGVSASRLDCSRGPRHGFRRDARYGLDRGRGAGAGIGARYSQQ